MNIIDFEGKVPLEIIGILGELIENAGEGNDLSQLEKSIEVSLTFIESENFSDRERGLLNYNISNAWSYIQRIKFPNEEFPLETVELEKQIIHLRIANNLMAETDDDFNKCQILTNLGNLFSHIGRFSEAQEYFNQCLEINNDFGMAIGNRGFGLYYYARVIFDPIQQFMFMKYARKDLMNAMLSKQVYNEAKYAFGEMIQQIENAFSVDDLNDFRSYNNFYRGIKKNEKEYKEWCAINKLFINPLNDILTESVIAEDSLFIPTLIWNPNEKLFFQSMFNQLKQEYTSARFLFYEALQNYHPHFADKNVVLMDTLDYSVYSFTLEKIKMVFRVCYSVFDKIAYFLNRYLNLKLDEYRVSFRTVWYTNLDKNRGLNNQFLITKNWAIRGLFWLSKDLFEKEFDSSIEPDAKEIASIRNFIEHKSFKIVESFEDGWSEKTETFEIDRGLFYDKTFRLLKLSRSAILYLSFLIYDEERKKINHDPSIPAVPINFIPIEDNEKI
ncbi:LA2681 family HEPN domain-containing protein [Leadbetterella sp. DM7]|uniref:LA2681 family HEPN domain-containing protein n=1 Tax=Leadbetterella sp. DM7 TaxID=3235085 RepID=UPI00349E5AEA